MTDNEGQPEGGPPVAKPDEGKAENWLATIELLGWFGEALVMIVRMIVGGIVAILHGCS